MFRRVDLPKPVDIPVRAESVCDTRMASTISPGGDPGAPKVQTTEHLLSACAGLGLDNLVIEITAEPHTGCGKFRARFGSDALRFVNSPTGKALRLRGACAKVVVPGQIRRGDPVRKLSPSA